MLVSRNDETFARSFLGIVSAECFLSTLSSKTESYSSKNLSVFVFVEFREFSKRSVFCFNMASLTIV